MQQGKRHKLKMREHKGCIQARGVSNKV